MIHRVACVLLVALVSAGGAEPFTHSPLNRQTPRLRLRVRGAQRSVAELEAVHLHNYALGTTTLVSDRQHQPSVALATVAGPRLSVRAAATPAVVEGWEAGIVPDLPGQPVPVAANTRPNRPPRVGLAARAPPV